ncbi:MAG: hypothetical protein BWK76_15775 [Desulfobulbaceae bacterium A2]|nr:MAG: hypothetical protein BWK76_15775 [Desulfobulbaceae bacterium A2]
MNHSPLTSPLLPPVTIERIIAGGRGLARLPDGLVVLLPLVLPGELVRPQVRRRRSGYLEAEALEILAPAPARVVPPCPLAGVCGGCDLMHAGPALQLAIKDAILAEALHRAGAHQALENRQAILPSPQPLGYRNRLRLHLDPAGRPGLRRAASDEVIPVPFCPVAAPALNRTLERLHQAARHGLLDPHWGRCDIQLSPVDDQVFAHLALPRPPTEKTRRRLASLAREAELADIALTVAHRRFSLQTEITRRPRLHLPAPARNRPLELCWEAGGFCQVNTGQNEVLVAEVCRLAQPRPQEKILDLYCGMGNFSLPLAARGAKVLGMEQDPTAVLRAQDNARANGLAQHCRFVAVAVTAGLTDLVRQGERFRTVVLDPPRQGLDGAGAQCIARLRPERIVYVSCDPATLARDLHILDEEGFRTSICRPLDMFPQTSHVESLVLLEKNW